MKKLWRGYLRVFFIQNYILLIRSVVVEKGPSKQIVTSTEAAMGTCF